MKLVLDKREVARRLSEMAELVELLGESREASFKARAYQQAARSLEALEEDFAAFIGQGRLTELRGVGQGLAGKITAFATGAPPEEYERLVAQVPPGVREILALRGLGPKRVKLLWQELGIKSVGELEYACHENRVARLRGFGPKTQENLLGAIAYRRQQAGRFLLPVAFAHARLVRDSLLPRKGVKALEIAGSLRRFKETVKDVDVLVACEKQQAPGIAEAFVRLPGVAEVVAQGEKKSSVIFESGLPCDLRLVRPRELPAALNYFTGSKEHNVLLRARAQKRGLKLNEYGLFAGEKPRRLQSEADLYQALGLGYIEPEMREGLGEIEAAERGELPRLVRREDLRGCIHCHTTYSDGAATLEQLAKACLSLNYEYLVVCDHSQSATYAQGLLPAEVQRQGEEIAELNARFAAPQRGGRGLRVLQGIESDILADGTLDYDEARLSGFEMVIASVHSHFNLDRQAQTRRLLRALENPHTDVIGHLTGRLLLGREGYEVDVEAVLQAAAARGVALELNCHPQRLDLDWRHLGRARELGVKIVLGVDAHSLEDLDDVFYGLGCARKGGLGRPEVLNCLGAEELLAHFAARK